MISATTLGLLSVAGVSTGYDLYSQQAEYKLQKQQLENQKLQQENQAIFQATQKTDQMARTISSQNAYAAANGMSSSSGYRNNLFYEGYEGNKDLAMIDSNLAAKQSKNEVQQAVLKSKKDIGMLKSVLDFGGNLFNTFSRPGI